MGKQWKQWQTLFSWAPESLWMVTAAMWLKDDCLGRKAVTNLDSVYRDSRDICSHDYMTKVYIVKAMVFLVVMNRCESWTVKKAEWKNWYFRTVVLEKTLESLLNSKEIKPVSPKGCQPWILFGRTAAEAPVLWLPDGKSQLIGKDPNAEKNLRQMEKRVVEGWDG